MKDVFDLPSWRTMPGEEIADRARHLERHVAASGARQPRPTVRRLTLVTVAAGALVGATAAGVYITWAPATAENEVRCYSVASLEGGENDFFGTTVSEATPADGRPVRRNSAIDTCSALWRQGVIAAREENVQPPQDVTLPVPPLTACTLGTGVAAVFPGGDETCRALGLPRLLE